MSEQTPSPVAPPPAPRQERRRVALAALGGGLSVILLGAGALAVAGIARADSPGPDPTSSSSPQPPPGPGSRHEGWGSGPGWGMPMPGGLGGLGSMLGPGAGIGGALHGQVVVKARDGSFQTYAGQRGTVTDVGTASISVKSEDGYQATYAVDKDTVVMGAEKVTDLAKGDDVAVVAKVTGGSSTATRIVDLKTLMKRMEQFSGRFDHGFRLGPWHGGSAKPTPSPSSTA